MPPAVFRNLMPLPREQERGLGSADGNVSSARVVVEIEHVRVSLLSAEAVTPQPRPVEVAPT
jgi:hypothetical protein